MKFEIHYTKHVNRTLSVVKHLYTIYWLYRSCKLCSMLADDMYVKFKIHHAKRVNRGYKYGYEYRSCNSYVQCWMINVCAV